jgi:hypothetical protein
MHAGPTLGDGTLSQAPTNALKIMTHTRASDDSCILKYPYESNEKTSCTDKKRYMQTTPTYDFSGFLPISYWQGTWWMLLGMEKDGWGAFGGGPEPSDGGCPRRTAEREAFEESHGALPLMALRQASCAPPLFSNARAHVFAVIVPNWLADVLNAIYETQNGQAPRNGCFEKRAARWAPLSAVRRPRSSLPGMPLRARLHISRAAADQCIRALSNQPQARCWTTEMIARSVQERNKQCGTNDFCWYSSAHKTRAKTA